MSLGVGFNELVDVLSQKNLGGQSLVNLCAGGETLLSKDIVPVVRAFLQNGHFVMIVTNGVITRRIFELCDLPDEYQERLFYKFSFHYSELKKRKLLETFFNNVRTVSRAGASFTIELNGYDGLEGEIDEIKSTCIAELQTLCHVTVTRDITTRRISHLTKKNIEDYNKAWQEFDSSFFEFKSKIFGVKRREYCFAGDWSYVLHLGNGEVTTCYGGMKIGNIYQKNIRFRQVGHNCAVPHCINGHAFLAYGVIPELETPTYASLRDRKGGNLVWLKPRMEAFFKQRLYEHHDPNKKDKSVNKIVGDKVRIKSEAAMRKLKSVKSRMEKIRN